MISTPPSPQPSHFTFELAAAMSESDYVRWHSLRSARPGRARAYRWGLTLLAALCFASWYTVTLGIVLGLIALALWTESRWMAWSSRNAYRLHSYLHTPLIYGVSSEAIWFRGGALRSECTWNGLTVWGVRDKFFWLSAPGMPQLIFPIAGLRDAGIYDLVRELATSHGVEYDSPAAQALLWKPRRATAT